MAESLSTLSIPCRPLGGGIHEVACPLIQEADMMTNKSDFPNQAYSHPNAVHVSAKTTPSHHQHILTNVSDKGEQK